jgi:glycosyltransferase involved in cell wall biosynthesis
LSSSFQEPAAPELLVAMPAFNEEASIADVVHSWIRAVSRETTGFVLMVINDGSTDATGETLNRLGSRFGSVLEVIHQKNIGHGQTCLKAYKIACQRKIPWVLQIDSDGQCDPGDFRKFWSDRERWDVLGGIRTNRKDGWRRILASRILSLVLAVVARVRCEDANVPFRLMRTSILEAKLKKVPPDFCLANIALAVLLRRDPAIRHIGLPIRFHARHGGEPSVPMTRFLEKAVQLVGQLHALRE